MREPGGMWPRGRVRAGLVALGMMVVAAGLMAPVSSRAQALGRAPKAWQPTLGDSLRLFADDAKTRLQASGGDHLGQRELRAFNQMDRIARAYFSHLGPLRMNAAEGLYAVLDTLGLKAEISSDPELPMFTLVLFLNPHFENYASLAYLYWFRSNEILSQPINLGGGRKPSLRVYWLGENDLPYEAAILHTTKVGSDGGPVLSLLRLMPDASAWLPILRGKEDLHLGDVGTAQWTDLDYDGVPELLTWIDGPPDAIFKTCTQPTCPRYRTYRVYSRNKYKGFEIMEERPLASPFATFDNFLRALRQGDEEKAASLVTNPPLLETAKEMRWQEISGEGAIEILRFRNAPPWSNIIRFKYTHPGEEQKFVEVHFVRHLGNWLLGDIIDRSSAAAADDSTAAGSEGC